VSVRPGTLLASEHHVAINNYISISRITVQFFRYPLLDCFRHIYEVPRALIVEIEDGIAVGPAR